MSEERSSLVESENQATYEAIDNDPYDSDNRATPPPHLIQSELISPSVNSTSTIQSATDQMTSTLPLMTKIGFGLGHIYNDLCAGVWFSYTLLFMQKALLIPGPEAGAFMMLGQVGDALFTPIVGFLVDRFGTKQKWHIIGKDQNLQFS